VTPDGQRILTCVGEEVLLTDVSTGNVLCRFEGVRSLRILLF
jgi:U3 small nucleolar RNA-associated protein 13